MELLNTLRWSEMIEAALADPSVRVLAGAFLLMLLTAATCHWLHTPPAPRAGRRGRRTGTGG